MKSEFSVVDLSSDSGGESLATAGQIVGVHCNGVDITAALQRAVPLDVQLAASVLGTSAGHEPLGTTAALVSHTALVFELFTFVLDNDAALDLLVLKGALSCDGGRLQ